MSSEIYEENIDPSAVTLDMKNYKPGYVFPSSTKLDEIFHSKHKIIRIPNFLTELNKYTLSPWKYCANDEDFYILIQHEGVFSLKTGSQIIKIKGYIPKDYPFK